MILYASWTGTKKNLQALRDHGWRLLMSPDTLKRCKGKTAPRWPDDTSAHYALDNGAWGCHQQSRPFDVDAFMWAFDRIGSGADWVVAPDIVGGGAESLSLTRAWLPKLSHRRVLIAVQDGMQPTHIRSLINNGRGIFLGGSTEWKLRTMPMWGEFARSVGCYFHVARVNTMKRLRACQFVGASSIDGSSATRFSVTADLLPEASRQLCLFRGGQ